MEKEVREEKRSILTPIKEYLPSDLRKLVEFEFGW